VKRCLHCIPSLEGGGAERQFAYLTTGLAQRGWEVHIAMLRDGPNYVRVSASAAIIHKIHARTNYDPHIVRQLHHIISGSDVKLVHTWLRQMDIFGGVAALRACVPWIMSERSSAAAYGRRFREKLRETLARRASAIACNSKGGSEFWQSRLGGRVPATVIPNGVPLLDIEHVTPILPIENGIADTTRLILSVARWDPGKNVSVLLSACRLLSRAEPTIVALCGTGAETARMADELKKCRGNVQIRGLGYVSNIWAWMKRADVLVSVSEFEGRPNAVLEGMACGCPLVVSDIPAHREFLDESCAVFVNPHDPVSVASGVEECVSNTSAARLRSAAARERVKAWSIDHMITAYESLYADLLARRKTV
jgi:glycosyltransferase involved in cell wall biosynthesis